MFFSRSPYLHCKVRPQRADVSVLCREDKAGADVGLVLLLSQRPSGARALLRLRVGLGTQERHDYK